MKKRGIDPNAIARKAYAAAARAGGEGQGDPTRPSDWFKMPQADLVTRRRHVFGLLRWYHEEWIEPRLGWRGLVMPVWWRLTGQKHRLVSNPWALIEAQMAKVVELEELKAQAEEARRALLERVAAAGHGGASEVFDDDLEALKSARSAAEREGALAPPDEPPPSSIIVKP